MPALNKSAQRTMLYNAKTPEPTGSGTPAAAGSFAAFSRTRGTETADFRRGETVHLADLTSACHAEALAKAGPLFTGVADPSSDTFLSSAPNARVRLSMLGTWATRQLSAGGGTDNLLCLRQRRVVFCRTH